MKNVLFTAIHLHDYYLTLNESLAEVYEYFHMIQAKRKTQGHWYLCRRPIKLLQIH